MTDFENIISYENLYKAHMRARLSKRHKREVILFEMNLSENLWNLHYDLKYGKYKISGYNKFMIYDPKEREIQAISYRDRILQHSLCDNYLMPLLEKRLIYDNAACRKNKGTSFAINRWRYFMQKYYKKYGEEGYFVKVDVKKYFNSINHNILKQKLIKIIKDDKIYSLLCNIIDSFSVSKNRGLPMGNQTSQCFALLYLNIVDRLIKENLKVKYYVRYMDDMLLLIESKSKAQVCLKSIKMALNDNLLDINLKSQIFPIKNGIDFLGWYFFYGKNGKIVQKLKKTSKKRILQRVKKTVNAFLKNKNKINVVKTSYLGHLKSGNSFNFIKRIKLIFG